MATGVAPAFAGLALHRSTISAAAQSMTIWMIAAIVRAVWRTAAGRSASSCSFAASSGRSIDCSRCSSASRLSTAFSISLTVTFADGRTTSS